MTGAQPPIRGQVWLADLDPTVGREQSGRRPVLVVSVDDFNHSGSELAVVIPLTSKFKRMRLHVPVSPPEGGLAVQSFIKVEDVRSLSVMRLVARWGTVSPETMAQVEDRLQWLLGL